MIDYAELVAELREYAKRKWPHDYMNTRTWDACNAITTLVEEKRALTEATMKCMAEYEILLQQAKREERERCAKECYNESVRLMKRTDRDLDQMLVDTLCMNTALLCGSRIRALP